MAGCNVTNLQSLLTARSDPKYWGHGGVQTFAGFGEIAFDRYRQPTGALGGTTELRDCLAIGRTAANTPMT